MQRWEEGGKKQRWEEGLLSADPTCSTACLCGVASVKLI